jgi:hypothetical protein
MHSINFRALSPIEAQRSDKIRKLITIFADNNNVPMTLTTLSKLVDFDVDRFVQRWNNFIGRLGTREHIVKGKHPTNHCGCTVNGSHRVCMTKSLLWINTYDTPIYERQQHQQLQRPQQQQVHSELNRQLISPTRVEYSICEVFRDIYNLPETTTLEDIKVKGVVSSSIQLMGVMRREKGLIGKSKIKGKKVAGDHLSEFISRVEKRFQYVIVNRAIYSRVTPY